MHRRRGWGILINLLLGLGSNGDPNALVEDTTINGNGYRRLIKTKLENPK